MPTISRFYGIVIRMWFADHPPPHFHAFEQDNEAQIRISDGEIIHGRLSRPAQRLVKQWTQMNRAILIANWETSRSGSRRPMQQIPGLDTPR